MKYQIKPTVKAVDLSAAWDSECWKDVEALQVLSARPESSHHRPLTELKLQYDEKGIYGLYNVQDQYIYCQKRPYQSSVCQDSCAEFFLELPGAGYFNFEINCGGSLLTYYIKDNTRTDHGFKEYMALPDEDMDLIEIFHTMPESVQPEITEPTTWRVGFFIPFALLQKHTNIAKPQAGTFWRMNAYKCGDKTSHPHWLSWNPVQELNFHRPEDFGVLEFC